MQKSIFFENIILSVICFTVILGIEAQTFAYANVCWKGEPIMAVTIKDVAKLANVNPSTVSRVIANNMAISQETRDRVLQAMKELDYRPNLVARNLVSRSAKTLGMVMPRAAEDLFLNPFFPELMRGISAVARQEGYDLLLAAGETEAEERETILRMVYGGRVDGLILMVSRIDNHLGTYIEETNVPVAMIGRPEYQWAQLCWVDNDNNKAAFAAADHLLKLGHTQIGCITGSMDFVVSRERLNGYKEALVKYGLAYDERLTTAADFSQEGGYRAMLALLARTKMTAVLAFDDLMAFGAMQAINERQMSVPKDISVIGFNNAPMSKFTVPSLSTVEIFPYQLGGKATELLIQKIRDSSSQCVGQYVATELVLRDST
jgi:DNA-binding LacI/PurR family transcriptional regulator